MVGTYFIVVIIIIILFDRVSTYSIYSIRFW